jgi:hypothetical protein
MKAFARALLLLCLAGLLVSCDQPTAPTPIPQGNQVTNVNVNVGVTQPSPSPSASPAAGACVPGIVEFLRVNPFGYDGCPGGPPPNANNSGLLPAGCTVHVTATPKDRNGVDVPASIHGTQIIWHVFLGAERSAVTDDPLQSFNKNVQKTTGSAPGEFSLQATICGITGAWNGRTTL